MMALESKAAFVTGGAQGLGQAYIQRFLEEGANVFYGDINDQLGKSTEKELQDKYGKERVVFFPFDVTNSDQFKEAFAHAVTKFGHLDIMVNNAGILNEALWEKMIPINFTGTVQGTKLAFDHMRKDKGGKGGRIINISSIMGLVDHQSQSVYGATKHAVRSFTSSMAMTDGLFEMGIEIAILCPDVSNTELITKLDESKVIGYDSQMKTVLDARMMSLSIVVEGLFILATKESINGAILLVTKKGQSFQKMDRVDLGTEWPIPKARV